MIWSYKTFWNGLVLTALVYLSACANVGDCQSNQRGSRIRRKLIAINPELCNETVECSENDDETVVDSILRSLRGDDDRERSAALHRLDDRILQQKSDQMIEALQGVWKTHRNQRKNVIERMPYLGKLDGRLTTLLREALADDEISLILAAIGTVGDLGEEAAGLLPELTRLIHSRTHYESEISAHLGRTRLVACDAVDVVRKLGPKAATLVPDLLKIVSDQEENEDLRVSSALTAHVLGSRSPSIFQCLRLLAKHQSAFTRQAAVEAISEIVTPASEMLDVLIKSSQDTSPMVRQASIRGLYQCGKRSSRCKYALERLTEDPDDLVQEYAAKELHKLVSSKE